MRIALIALSVVALLWTIVPAAAYAAGSIELEQTKLHMLIGTIAWFVIAPLWMLRRRGVPAAQEHSSA